MTVTRESFVAAFPAFASTTTYPDGMFDFWLEQAGVFLSPYRFGNSTDLAIMLFLAHNLTLAAKDALAASGGGFSGDASGPVSSKSVGPVSKSYDNSLTAIAGAGPWNLTAYGQRLYWLIRAVGTGPVYVPGPSRSFQFPLYGNRFS